MARIPSDKHINRRSGGPGTNATQDTVFGGKVQAHIALSRLPFAKVRYGRMEMRLKQVFG